MTSSGRVWGFDPTIIKDKVTLWLDFTDSSTLTLDTGKIVTVADKSGKGFDFTQSTPANRFTLVQDAVNGRQAARCAGSPEFMENPTNLPISDLYVVLTNNSDTPIGRVFGWAVEGVSSYYEYGYVAGPKILAGYLSNNIKSNPISNLSKAHIIHIRMAGDSSNAIFVNSVDDTESKIGDMIPIPNKKNIGRGATSGGWEYWSGGDISMIVGFYPALNNREQKLMDSLLSSIYGL